MYKAELKNYRQSPRKVRLVADVVRGKKVDRALVELNFLNKRAAVVVKKLIDSAVANAKHNFKAEKENLIVKEIRVDEARTLKRFRAGARGMGFGIKKRSSRILVSLAEVDGKKTEKATKKEKTSSDAKSMKDKEKKTTKKAETKVKTADKKVIKKDKK